jgi:hypothetical protein
VFPPFLFGGLGFVALLKPFARRQHVRRNRNDL